MEISNLPAKEFGVANTIKMDYQAVHNLAGQVSEDAALYVSISDGASELQGEVNGSVVHLPTDTVGGAGKTDNQGVEAARAQERAFSI